MCEHVVFEHAVYACNPNRWLEFHVIWLIWTNCLAWIEFEVMGLAIKWKTHLRPRGILRKETNVSDVSDGTGQLDLPALFGPNQDGGDSLGMGGNLLRGIFCFLSRSSHVQEIRALTESEKEQVKALRKMCDV